MLFPFHMGVHTPFRDNHYQWIISFVKYCTFVLHVLLTGISNAHKEDVWPGQWIAEDNWPSSNVLLQELTLHEDRRLAPESEGREKNVLNESETKVIIKTSFLSGSWCGLPLAFSLEELPVDQRLEDALSECWETATLKEPVSVVGFPEVHLQLSCDRPCALVAARLCDVFPNGESSLISRGTIYIMSTWIKHSTYP